MERQKPDEMDLGEIIEEIVNNAFEMHRVESIKSIREDKGLGPLPMIEKGICEFKQRQEFLYQELSTYKK